MEDFFSRLKVKSRDRVYPSMYHLGGGDITARGGGITRMNFLGNQHQYDANTGKWTVMGKASNKFGGVAGSVLGSAAGIAMSGVFMASEFMSGGVFGLGQAASWEMTLNHSLIKYGYNYGPADAAGIRKVIPASTKLGKFARGAVFMGRSLVGSMAAYGAGGALPGLIGFGAGHAAGYLGTRFAGPMALGAVAAGGAYLAYKGTSAVLKAGYNHAQQKKGIHTSGSLASFHTRGAYTMRARAVQAMHKSHLNARSALGQEASYLHMPSRNYNSRYRMMR